MPIEHVAILGSGITGITTAIVLQESGYSTTVYSHLRADVDTDRHLHPHFASIFPAACIVPHSVESGELLGLFEESQDVFARLEGNPLTGIRWQTHYELEAGDRCDLPAYTRVLRDCVPFGTQRNHLPFAEALERSLSGWVSTVLFAEMPVYLDYLFRRYRLSGGRLVPRTLRPGDVRSLRESSIVNCTGLWSHDLFRDPSVHPIRGHLVFLNGAPFPPLNRGTVFSYNYKPPDVEYLYDAYFFPRSGDSEGRGRGWLLGGSREVGHSIHDHEWTFPTIDTEMRSGVPAPVEDINRIILRRLTGVDILSMPRSRFAGMRPGRHGGVRLELASEEGRAVVHNYGHGGGGVALSWGCALKVRSILDAV